MRLDNVTLPEAVEAIQELIRRGTPSYVVTPNVDHMVRLEHDAAFQAAYAGAALVLADGMPLLWACRFLGRPLRAKVSGSDLFEAFAAAAARAGHRLFFLGGRPGSANEAARRLTARYPGLEVCGVHVPPLGFESDPETNARALDAVRAARPDLLFVALGAPKQELWIARHHAELGVPVSIGVGAAFDFTAGVVRRAPRALQRVGLEWSWRLAHEPRRLWRRYLVKDPRFFQAVWRQWRQERRAPGA